MLKAKKKIVFHVSISITLRYTTPAEKCYPGTIVSLNTSLDCGHKYYENRASCQSDLYETAYTKCGHEYVQQNVSNYPTANKGHM